MRKKIPLPAVFYRTTIIVSLLIVLLTFRCNAQVVNDGIKERSELILDGDYTSSSTNHATVEWACVNKALTRKCIDYHNDQWFSFKVSASGKYFLNVSSQACRDARGIQAIVIEGNPCEIKTYKILQCIPQIRQQDVYIELDSIKANQHYLVNIDGFLGDFCTFNIQLSTNAKGLALKSKNLDTLDFTTHQSDKVVSLKWKVDQLLANELRDFEILRTYKRNLKPTLIGIIPVDHNALGTSIMDYSLEDTLSASGTYTYEILGIFKGGEKEILSQEMVKFYPEVKPRKVITLDVSLDYKKGTPIILSLLDKERNSVLKKSYFKFNKMYDSSQRIPVDMYVDMGIRKFVVRCVNLKTQREINYEFEVEEDDVIRK